MKQGTFPVKPDPSVAQPPPIGLHLIGPFIELSQLNKPAAGQPLYVHRLKDSFEVRIYCIVKTNLGAYILIFILILRPFYFSVLFFFSLYTCFRPKI